MPDLHLTVRYYRHGTDEGSECTEANFSHREREWFVPSEQAALVMVDCWAEHYVRSHQENSGRIMRENLLPAAKAARAAGLTVVHAPSPTWIRAYDRWRPYGPDQPAAGTPADSWPPAEFRRREGRYARYARDPEPKVTAWVKDLSHYRIFEPLGPEPGDFVVANGDELHRLLEERKVLHLFYAGFAANICVLFRDYGTRAMAQRGYNVVLLRDATIAIESHDTIESRALTLAAVRSIETLTGHTTTTGELIRACQVAVPD